MKIAILTYGSRGDFRLAYPCRSDWWKRGYIDPSMMIRFAPGPRPGAWSLSVLPPSSDWPPNVHVTGYYFLSSKEYYQLPAQLQSFLQAGKPPVCITFGSMVNHDAEK